METSRTLNKALTDTLILSHKALIQNLKECTEMMDERTEAQRSVIVELIPGTVLFSNREELTDDEKALYDIYQIVKK